MANNNSITATINGIVFSGLSIEQAQALAGMATETVTEKKTQKREPNAKRVVNANRCEYSQVSGVPVVDCKSYKFWPVVNDASTIKVIETEIAKQRKAGYEPDKVVIAGYRAIVKVDKSADNDKYKSIKHGALRSFHNLKWTYNKREHGYHIDLNKIDR